MTEPTIRGIALWDGMQAVYFALMEKLTADLVAGVEPQNAGWLECRTTLEQVMPSFKIALKWVKDSAAAGQINMMISLSNRPEMRLTAAGIVTGAQAAAQAEGGDLETGVSIVFDRSDLATIKNPSVSETSGGAFRAAREGELNERDIHDATDVAGYLNTHLIAWTRLVATPDGHYAIPLPEKEAARAFLYECLSDATLPIVSMNTPMGDYGEMVVFLYDPRLIRFTHHELRRLNMAGHELASRLRDAPGLSNEAFNLIDLLIATHVANDPDQVEPEGTTVVELLQYYHDALMKDEQRGTPPEEQGWRLAQPDVLRGALAVETLYDAGWLESRADPANPVDNEYRMTAEGMTLVFLLSPTPTRAG